MGYADDDFVDDDALDLLIYELFGNETDSDSMDEFDVDSEDAAFVDYADILETRAALDVDGFEGDEFVVRSDEATERNLADSDSATADSLSREEEKDLLFTEMTAIIIFLIVCGVVYVGWRCLIDHRERKRELDYYHLSEAL